MLWSQSIHIGTLIVWMFTFKRQRERETEKGRSVRTRRGDRTELTLLTNLDKKI